MLSIDHLSWSIFLALFWGASGCSINDRKEPNAPKAVAKSSASEADGSTAAPSGTQRLGRLLYERHCADCHNPLATTTKRRVTTDDILRGISRIPAMANELGNVKINELSAIAEALK